MILAFTVIMFGEFHGLRLALVLGNKNPVQDFKTIVTIRHKGGKEDIWKLQNGSKQFSQFRGFLFLHIWKSFYFHH